MSGEIDSGAAGPLRRINLFGRASKQPSSVPALPAPPKPPRMDLSGVSGLLTFVLLGALATVGALAWLLKESRSPGPLGADKVVMIVREDDGGSIADQLERAGVIDSALWFNVLTLLDGDRGALKRGEYKFKAGISMNELENQLIAHRNPGRAALEAVANPTRSKDLYFVAERTGGHVFAETLDQHQKNVARWRRIEKDVKDKAAPDVTPQPAPAISRSIDPVDPSQFGALVAPTQGRSSPAATLARLRRIGAGRQAQDAALASLVAPGVKSLEEIGGVVTGVNDGPAEGVAFNDAGSAGGSEIGPIASAPVPQAMLADERAREAKYSGALLASNGAIVGATTPAAPTSPQPPTASGRPRIFDASEGTRLDPLLNKTYDLSYAKVVPPMQ
jgi:hypothetical protein